MWNKWRIFGCRYWNKWIFLTDFFRISGFFVCLSQKKRIFAAINSPNDMLKRKFAEQLERFLLSEPDKILLVNGARQVGKSYLIRYVGTKLYKTFIEINLKEDKENDKVFEDVHSTQDLYIRLSNYTDRTLGDISDTLIFLDEIQCYPHLMTLLKFLRQERRYRFIASGSQLGVALSQTPSVPLGSVEIKQMYPLDFEEFLWAMGLSEEWIADVRQHFLRHESLPESSHANLLKRFQYYLLVGGLPEAVNLFLDDRNIIRVRSLQHTIHELYKIDVSQYDEANRLKIRRIYDLVPSNLENKKKRIVYQQIENKKGKHFADYADEFDYLTNSGITLEVKAISNPHFPLKESESKNLLKLYLNDVGLLTQILYGNNVNAVLQDQKSINLGTVYEAVVAQELHAHGFPMFYYDKKKTGEVDFLVDDYDRLNVLPLEVKSGKDYKVHSALDRFVSTPTYGIDQAIVFSNERQVHTQDRITYMPIYYCMFLQHPGESTQQLILDEIEPV